MSLKRADTDTTYHDYLDNAPNAVFVVDSQGRYLEVNPAACRLTGYSEGELLARRIADLAAPEDAASSVARFSTLLETGRITADIPCLRKDGKRIWLELHAARVGPDRFVGFANEITSRKQLEWALLDRERKLESAQRVAKLGHWELDPKTRQVSCSDELLRIFGLEREEATLDNFFRVFDSTELGEVLANLQRAIADGTPWDVEHRLILGDGTIKIMHAMGAASKNEAGEIVKLFGTVQDITERKRQEEERRHLEAQILHSQKLESLGLLAGGIAHDFNNLLVGIIGHADRAMAQLPADSPALPHVREVTKTAELCAALTGQMLAYSGKGTFVAESVCLRELVDDMESLLRASVSKNVALHIDIPEGLAPVEADPAQLRQILLNLVINASEAIGDEPGEVRISTATGVCVSTCPCREAIPGSSEWPERPTVILQVSDTGCGMDEATRAQIFDPFFSTKFTGRGLGLAAVHGIVRGHRAGLEVESELGRGTTFRVHFPVGQHETHVTKTLDRATSDWRGRGTVLLVDDEPLVLEVVEASLLDLGFDVVSATDGRHAISMFEKHRADIVCVVLDLTMPSMGGEQAFRALRAMREDIPIVVASGYSEESLSSAISNSPRASFLQKPFRFEDLQACLRSALGQ